MGGKDKGQGLVVGTKQTLKAARSGCLKKAYIAKDCESALFARLYGEMLEFGVEVEFVPTMKRLGDMCAIEVGSAVAGVLAPSGEKANEHV